MTCGLNKYSILFVSGVYRGGFNKPEPERNEEVHHGNVNHGNSEMDPPADTQDDYELALAQKSQVSKKSICFVF